MGIDLKSHASHVAHRSLPGVILSPAKCSRLGMSSVEPVEESSSSSRIRRPDLDDVEDPEITAS